MKKLTALLLALVMVLSLAACGAKETTPETKAPEAAAPVETKAPVEEAPAAPTSLNIYGIYKSESPYFVNEAASIEKALNDKGAEYGIEVTWHFLNCDGDAEKYMTQIDTAIADNADAIVGNMDSQIFLGGSEPGTLKDLSEILGKETIDSFNTSDTRGNSPSYGTSFQKLGHELLSRDELAVLDGGKCILQLRGVRPFLSDKYDLTQHPNYKLTSDYDPKNTFDIEKYLNRKEKINPNDEFVVIDADSLPSA